MTTVLSNAVRGGAPPSLMAGWAILRQMPDCTCLRRSRCLMLQPSMLPLVDQCVATDGEIKGFKCP